MKNNTHKSFTTETMVLFFIFCLLICLVSSGCKPEKPEGPVYNIALYNDIYGDDESSIYASVCTYSPNISYGGKFCAGAYSGEYSDCKEVDDDVICIHTIDVGDNYKYDYLDCIFQAFSIHKLCSSDAILVLSLEGSRVTLKVVCVDSCEETVSEGIDINLFESSSEIIIDLDNYEED